MVSTSVNIGSPLLYTIFSIVIGIMVLIDMLALKHTGDHKVSIKEALIWTIIWVVVALLFNVGLWWYLQFHAPPELAHIDATSKALEFLTGYVVEKSLSMDNIFIFLLIFTYFQVPNKYQRRVLVYGILMAIFLRVVMVLIGSYLIESFEWILYIFGAFLIITGLKMIKKDDNEGDLSNNKLLKIIRRLFKFTDHYYEEKFFVVIDKVLYATPLFLVLMMITFSDVIFAVDSVPAVFAVSKDPFIVMTSNIFAILGLRAMYFLLADMAERFYLLHYGLAFILTFIGIKMLIAHYVEIPTLLSLGVILGTLFLTIILSLLFPAKGEQTKPS